MFSNARSQLELAEILPGYRYHKNGAVILRELLKNESLPYTGCYELMGAEGGNIRNKLLETNILAHHYGSGDMTFHSTVMKRFCEENSALWEGK
jgi:hypothetical protein